MSAPYASIGHNKRAAISHARYAFLEHYAFGELAPANSIPIPNLLYAELDSKNSDKQAIVEEMARSIGATLKVESKPLKKVASLPTRIFQVEN